MLVQRHTPQPSTHLSFLHSFLRHSLHSESSRTARRPCSGVATSQPPRQTCRLCLDFGVQANRANAASEVAHPYWVLRADSCLVSTPPEWPGVVILQVPPHTSWVWAAPRVLDINSSCLTTAQLQLGISVVWEATTASFSLISPLNRWSFECRCPLWSPCQM